MSSAVNTTGVHRPARLKPALGLVAACLLAGVLTGLAAAIVNPLILIAGLAGLAVAGWAIRTPERALWLLIAVIALVPRVASPVSIGFKPTLLDAALFLLIAAWLLQLTRHTLDLGSLPITLPLFGLMAVAVATFVFGLPNGALTTQVVRRFAEMLLSLAAVFVIIAILRDAAALRRTVKVFIVLGAISAAVGIFLYVIPGDLAIRLLSALRPFDYPTGPEVLRFVRDDPSLLQRATGLWIDPNAYGGFLLVAGALALPQLFATKPVLPRWAAVLCAGLIGLALVFTVSRGAMLGFLVVALLVGSLRYRRLLLVMVAALALVLVLPQTRDLVAHFADGFMARDLATQMRFGEYKDAIRLIERYPALGVGFADTPDVDLYIGVSMMYLLMAQQMGLLGLAAFLSVMAAVFLYAARAVKPVWANDDLFPVWLGAHAAIAGILMSGIFDHYFANINFHNAVMLLWVVVALAVASSRAAITAWLLQSRECVNAAG